MAEQYQLAFWRPAKSGKGAGAIFSLNENGQAWLRIMPQAGEKAFNNEAALNVKIGQNDIGQMLMVANYREEGIGNKGDSGFWSGLMHKFGETTTAITLNTNKDGTGYYLGVSRKQGDGEPTRMGVGLSRGDVELLRVFLERAAWASMFDEGRPAQDGGEATTQAASPKQAAAPAKPAASKVTKVSKVAKVPVAAAAAPSEGEGDEGSMPF